MNPEANKEAAIQAWLRLYGGNDIDVAADVGKFYDYFIGPAITTTVDHIRERLNEAAISMRGWQDREYRYIPEYKAAAILDDIGGPVR